MEEETEFKKLLDAIRSSILKVGDKSVIAPILPYVNLSLTPNSKLVGKYMHHLKNSYFCV